MNLELCWASFPLVMPWMEPIVGENSVNKQPDESTKDFLYNLGHLELQGVHLILFTSFLRSRTRWRSSWERLFRRWSRSRWSLRSSPGRSSCARWSFRRCDPQTAKSRCFYVDGNVSLTHGAHHGTMGSLHRQVAVLVPDGKLNCFDFGQKKEITFIRDQ